MIKKLFIGFTCLIGLVISLAIAGGIYTYTQVEPWPEDIPGIKLRPSIPSYDEAPLTKSDGYYYLINLPKLNGTLSEEAQKALEACEPNVEVESYLKANQNGLVMLQKAMNAPFCIPRMQLDLENDPHLIFTKVRDFTRLFLYKTYSRSKKVVDLQPALSLMTMYNQISNGPIVDHLISIAMRKMVLDIIQQNLDQKRCNLEQRLILTSKLKQFDKSFNSLYNSFRVAQYILRSNYINSLKIGTNDLVKEGLISHSWAKKDLAKTDKNIRSTTKLFLSVAASPFSYSKKEYDSLNKLNDEKRLYSSLLLSFIIQTDLFDAKARFSLLNNSSIYLKYIGPNLEAKTKIRGMILYTAVHGYIAEHGKLPKSVDDLIPTYFDEVPKNPYANDKENILYRKLGDTEWEVYTKPAVIPLDQDKKEFALSIKGKL